MTFIERLRSLFVRTPVSAVSTPVTVAPAISDVFVPADNQQAYHAAPTVYALEDSLPSWLADEEALRDEGVLFGLADAQTDEKVTEIRAHIDQQAAPIEKMVEQYTQKVEALNQVIHERESRIASLKSQIEALQEQLPIIHDLLRTSVSLLLAIGMSIGNFYLVDETLRPAFPNRWIAVGVFLAGMFNLFGRTSFFYEEGTRLSGRRLIEEVALPMAAALFVLAQAVQMQSIWQAGSLFVFIFFLFLLTGKLLLSTLTRLQNGFQAIRQNRQLLIDKQQNLPVWVTDRERLVREVEAIRNQQWPLVTTLKQLETDLARLNAKRDQLVSLFLSEYQIARSIRDRLPEQRLPEQQREALFN
ncbi:hypothetical protein [Spirosoma oryzicola]|uniref:hypothetical protein n=1 Tax=Spirosoma oryzicola TaxID=2898794 RepID=UPI001E31D3CB|nr:hypothetical protein [Spirosoma oryzicola]UHG89025.1 hypothetical protein LQ777_12285 [Spirosoma oryzicola]